MPTSEPMTARDAAQRLAEALEAGEALPGPVLQRVLAALVRDFGRRRDLDERARPFAPGDDVPATAVAQTALGMLEAADMAVFELGMWQSIKRAPAGGAPTAE